MRKRGITVAPIIYTRVQRVRKGFEPVPAIRQTDMQLMGEIDAARAGRIESETVVGDDHLESVLPLVAA